MTKDPLGPHEGGDLNSYRYAGNNPLSMVDPMGNDTERLITWTGANPHSVLRVYDPKMPGNNVYIDMGPNTSESKILTAFMPTQAYVGINYDPPSSRVLFSEYRVTTPAENSRILERAIDLSRAADSGDLLYDALDFTMENQQQGKAVKTNCFGFTGGL